MPCERIKPDRDWLTFVAVVNRGVNYAQIVLLHCRGWVTSDLRPARAGWPDEADGPLSPESIVYINSEFEDAPYRSFGPFNIVFCAPLSKTHASTRSVVSKSVAIQQHGTS
jgi:hypothetical protein